MKILLITTSTNAVRTTLEQESDVELFTIDCLAFRQQVLDMLEQATISNPPDILLTYRCPIIIPKTIYSRARIGAYNIHPSLLPKYPGLNPWEAIFQNKERESGISIHFLSEVPDGGEIVLQDRFQIAEDETVCVVRKKADIIAARMAKELLNRLTFLR